MSLSAPPSLPTDQCPSLLLPHSPPHTHRPSIPTAVALLEKMAEVVGTDTKELTEVCAPLNGFHPTLAVLLPRPLRRW